MKLLFDQNISHRLVAALQQEYAGSQHVREVGLRDASDVAVWQFAARNGLAIVTIVTFLSDLQSAFLILD